MLDDEATSTFEKSQVVMDDWPSTLASGRSIVSHVEICYVQGLDLERTGPRREDLGNQWIPQGQRQAAQTTSGDCKELQSGHHGILEIQFSNAQPIVTNFSGIIITVILESQPLHFSLDALKTLKIVIKYFWRLQLTQKTSTLSGKS